MANDTKQRMIETTAELLRVKGLSATSFTDITTGSGATRGVIYHHFPEGKSELARQAVEWTGAQVLGHLGALDADTPLGLVDQYLAAIRHVVRQSAEGSSCAIAAVVIESTPGDGALAATADTVLRSWIGELRDKFTALGVPRTVALHLATLLIVVLEGSHILARASGGLTQFDRTARATRQAAVALL